MPQPASSHRDPARASSHESADQLNPVHFNHLNDVHHWSRDHIADWVETLEQAPSVPAGLELVHFGGEKWTTGSVAR
jgi:hypothetical protein